MERPSPSAADGRRVEADRPSEAHRSRRRLSSSRSAASRSSSRCSASSCSSRARRSRCSEPRTLDSGGPSCESATALNATPGALAARGRRRRVPDVTSSPSSRRASVAFYRLDSGARRRSQPVPGLGASDRRRPPRAASLGHSRRRRSQRRARLADAGALRPAVRRRRSLKDVVHRGASRAAIVDARSRRARRSARCSYVEQDGQKFVAGLRRRRRDRATGGRTPRARSDARALRARATAPRSRRSASAATARCWPAPIAGRVYHWELAAEPRLTDISPVSTRPITALEWMLGGNSWVAGAEDGSLSGWLRAPPPTDGDRDGAGAHLRAAGRAGRRPWRCRAASAASRRSAATATIVLRHQTSERVAGDAAAARAGERGAHHAEGRRPARRSRSGALRRYALVNPHPEISWKTLFGKVWYEGYAEAGVRLAVDRRDRRHRAEVQPRAAHLRHDQGHALRDAVRGSAGGARRALHLAVRRSRRSARRSSRPSRSWRRCRASSSASWPVCTWRRWSSGTSSRCC